MKSITIRPERSLILICLDISSAASRFVFKAVFSMFISFIDLPEFISIDTSASVGLITIYPPEVNFTVGSKIRFTLFSIPVS